MLIVIFYAVVIAYVILDEDIGTGKRKKFKSDNGDDVFTQNEEMLDEYSNLMKLQQSQNKNNQSDKGTNHFDGLMPGRLDIQNDRAEIMNRKEAMRQIHMEQVNA